MKLKEAEKTNFRHLNRFIEKSKDLSLNFDSKRKWNKQAKTFKDLLNGRIDSRPWNTKELR